NLLYYLELTVSDTRDAYKCQCKEGYVDHDELRNPGRDCRKANQICESGRHDCDKNAQCIERGTNDYECVCKAGFLDRSPLPHRTGRECRELINECLDSSLNDCDPAATCRDTPDSYECECPIGSRDISKDPSKRGRNCFGVSVH
ncbi:hypothetical protein GCK32_013403, partial [Trichostrongylus colubriformis]